VSLAVIEALQRSKEARWDEVATTHKARVLLIDGWIDCVGVLLIDWLVVWVVRACLFD
jgi:hypothetical protein